jgi:hypothetical protein
MTWIKVALVEFLFLTPKEDRMRSATSSTVEMKRTVVVLQTKWGIRR